VRSSVLRVAPTGTAASLASGSQASPTRMVTPPVPSAAARAIAATVPMPTPLGRRAGVPPVAVGDDPEVVVRCENA